jgi:serine/threonine-protein kinase
MGVVYKARQVAFDRLVAIKMIRSQVLAGPDELARFRTEAQAVGRLDHPHVVRVHAFGQEEECPYFVMEYLCGGSLAQRLREGPLEVRRAAELVRQVALGVQAAHEAGVLHRDLKPGNVLVDAEGNARVADFGLAKLLDGDGGQTASAAVMGTPAYMSPEQAEGKAREVGCAVDVWALGVSLYECLTGQQPFKGSTRAETLARVKNQPPTLPRKLRPEVPVELERVCLKCLEKDPQQRYPSAGALADDLERWLQGKEVAARAPSRLVRGWRLARTHRGLSLAALILLIGLAGWFLKPHRPSPRQPRETLEAALAAGLPYELDEAGSLPGPLRWVVGDGVWLRANKAGDGFSCGTLETGLLELIVPPCDRYLFSAEVRHDDHGGVSHLGLYLGYREHRTVSGEPQSGFFTFSFADRGPLAETLQGKDGKPASIAILRASLFERRKGMEWVPRSAIGARQLFVPDLPQGRPGPWRELAVKVTPAGVEGFWRDDRGKRNRFTTISARELQQAIEALERSEPGMAGIPARFEPRSGLGLFVYRGQGSFRRIRLEPLPGSGQ